MVRLDRQAEGTLPPHTFAILLVYFLQQQTKPVLPCIHEWLDHRDDDTYVAPHEKLAGWRTQNKMTPAELWIELFAFLSVGFKSAELVVSLRKAGATTNEDKQWKTRKLAVEDPYSFKRNLCRSIQALSVYDYISDCLKTGYLYFGTIQTSLGPVITRIIVKNKEDEDKTENKEDEEEVSIVMPENQSYGGVSMFDHQVNMTDWTLESWLAVKGAASSKYENLHQNQKPLVDHFLYRSDLDDQCQERP